MTIKTGDKIPAVTLRQLGAAGIEELNAADYVAGKTVIIFGVPGAFTPSCAQKHLPGYIENAEAIKAKGVDEIICLSVNDPFVMAEWSQQSGAAGKVTLLSDGNGELTKAMGLDFDGSGAGLGVRSLRYVMIVKDGVIDSLDIEAAPSDVELSGAQACMLKL